MDAAIGLLRCCLQQHINKSSAVSSEKSDQVQILNLYMYVQTRLALRRSTMASKQMIVVMASALAVVAFLPALAAGTEHWVGDGKGWTLGFDYAAWAETKQFKVGDTIVFKYKEPSHTVLEVGGADFAACNKPVGAAVMGTGEDRVTLDAAGRRWFVCGVGLHCQNGMKLKINVVAADEGAAPAPAGPPSMPPPPSNPAGQVHAGLTQIAVASLIAAALVF